MRPNPGDLNVEMLQAVPNMRCTTRLEVQAAARGESDRRFVATRYAGPEPSGRRDAR